MPTVRDDKVRNSVDPTRLTNDAEARNCGRCRSRQCLLPVQANDKQLPAVIFSAVGECNMARPYPNAAMVETL